MDSYPLLKTLHLAGAVMFLGNIVVSGWWKAMANRSRDPVVIAFAQGQVSLTDWVFTAGGATLLALGGYTAAALHGPAADTLWIAAGHWLFVASGLIWVAVLLPLQAAQARSARAFAAGGVIPPAYWRRERRWALFGSLATLLPCAGLYFMVFKPV